MCIKFENVLKNEDWEQAHLLIEDFKRKFEKVLEIEEIPQIKELLERDKEFWKEYENKQFILSKQLDPLEIQFNSYIKTNNFKLAQDTLNKAEELLK